MPEEIEEIMDDEENNITSINNYNLINVRSAALTHLICLHVTNIRAHIREQIEMAKSTDKNQTFCYYLEMRSFIDEGCTKVGMFDIGDGNTETNPSGGLFLYTIPYIFTSEALISFLKTVIDITGIREYSHSDSEGMPIVSGISADIRKAAYVQIGKYTVNKQEFVQIW